MTTTSSPELPTVSAGDARTGDEPPVEERGSDGLAWMRGGRRGWIVRRFLLVADVVGLTVAFVVASRLFPPLEADRLGPSREVLLFFGTLPVWVVLFKGNGLYDADEDRTNHSTADDLAGLFHAITIGVFMTRLVGWLTQWFDPSPPKLFTFWALAIGAVTVCRSFARVLVRRLPLYVQRTVIVGTGDAGRRLGAKIEQHPEYGIDLLGFVDGHAPGPPTDPTVRLLGPIDELERIVADLQVDRVIVAFPEDGSLVPLSVVRALADDEVRIDVVPRFSEALGLTARLHSVEGSPLAALPRLRLSRSDMFVKRTLDVTFASLALVLLSPLLAAVAVAIAVDTRGPVLFRQTRMGQGGKAFRIFKFRTMVRDADEHKHEVAVLNKHAREGGDPRMFKIPRDPRVTRVGAFLRRWSLDELPQLLNVVRGEMSLVGPRPLIPEESAHVVDWRERRLYVKPGITGLWQVLGRDDIPFEEMAVLDYRYVTSWSLLGDLQLILRTLPAMARPRNAY